MFTLNIDTGNAAMADPQAVADALRKTAAMLETLYGHGSIDGRVRDENGNTVGSWALELDA